MTKLEWKGCPRSNKIEDIEVLIIGDSMIKNINCEQFRNTTWLYAYPGITALQLRFHLQNEVGLPPPSKIGVVYIHVGTNNVSTLREQKAGPAIIHEQKGVISIVQQIYKSAVVLCGSILPRYDQENPRAIEVNRAIEKYVVDSKNPQLQFVDLWERFYNNTDLYRYAQTMNRRGMEPDPVHLSDKGVFYLQQEIRKDIEKAVKLKLTLKTNVGEVMTTEEWRRFRKLTCNDRMQSRFKVTNYKEGANQKDHLVPYTGPKLTYSTPIAAINPMPVVTTAPCVLKDYKKLDIALPTEPQLSAREMTASRETSQISTRETQSNNDKDYRAKRQRDEKKPRSSESPNRRKRLLSPDDSSPEKQRPSRRKHSSGRSRSRSRSRHARKKSPILSSRRSRRSPLALKSSKRRKRSSSSSADRSKRKSSPNRSPVRQKSAKKRKYRTRSPLKQRSSNTKRRESRSSSRAKRKRSPYPKKAIVDSSGDESSSSSSSSDDDSKIIFNALLKERLRQKRSQARKKTPPRKEVESYYSEEEVYNTPTKKKAQPKRVTKASLQERLREKKVSRTVTMIKKLTVIQAASDDDEILTDTEF